jgi:hypothetical protein
MGYWLGLRVPAERANLAVLLRILQRRNKDTINRLIDLVLGRIFEKSAATSTIRHQITQL